MTTVSAPLPLDAPVQRRLTIERRRAAELPYAAFYAEYALRNRPVIIEDCVPHWGAMQRWTPAYFAERFGTKMVDVTDGMRMNFGEFIARVEASTSDAPAPYLHKLIIHKALPEVLPDVSPGNPYGFAGRFASPAMPKPWNRPDGYLKLLIGGPGGKFPYMHFDADNAHAMITEIYGDKEFVLFDPADGPLLYPRADWANCSQVDDLDDPDLTRFPRFVEAVAHHGTIHPGDAIFIPCGWWHAARVRETSISVCVNMLDASNWNGFVDDASRRLPGRSPLRQASKRVILSALGALLDAGESLQRLPLIGNALARLAPCALANARNHPGGSPT